MTFSIKKNLFWFLLVLLVVFAIHLSIKQYLKLPLFEHRIVLSYVLNYLIAAVIMLFLFVVRKKHKDNLGYLFLIGSGLKFIAFYVIFFPVYKSDGVIQKAEFFTFFIPYVSCLVLETFTLIRLLYHLDDTGAKSPKNKELK